MALNINNHRAFNARLHPLDSETQTFGCRQTNPNFCAKNGLPAVCALVRKDAICLSPPRSWKMQFAKLKAKAKA